MSWCLALAVFCKAKSALTTRHLEGNNLGARQEPKSWNFEIFRVFRIFCHAATLCRQGEAESTPAEQREACSRVDTLGMRRNTPECRRCAGDTPGHSGNTFWKIFFCDFSPNLKNFWTKNVHFPKDFLWKWLQKCTFSRVGPKKKFLKSFSMAPYSLAN